MQYLLTEEEYQKLKNPRLGLKYSWWWNGKLEPKPGAFVKNCIEEIINSIGRGEIEMTFNGVTLIIKHNSKLEDLLEEYHKK